MSKIREVKEYGTCGDNAFPDKGNLKPDDEGLRLLKKKISDLEEENAIIEKLYASSQSL